MAQAMLSIRVDSDDKKRFEEFCNETGMNVSVAVNMFMKKVIREQKIPFEINADPFYSEANLARLRKSIADVESGKATLKEHELLEVDE
ncbi:MAG: type II toxin-antitoxin system RelB/DinJ family antitoxin [Lachnospiraceae bacterium]|nr:type II toxin-antitoxin system RelB/DinJ family antitoxin [Lachnospiraceae bacterium]